MKTSCFLITIILVNASADDKAEYKKKVFLANLAFKRAYNFNAGSNSRESGLELVIVNKVNFNSHLRNPFAKINFMIAVPDQTDIVNDIPEHENLSPMQKCCYYQYVIQRGIIITLNSEISDESQIIAYPKADEGQDFEALSLTTLANERREYVVEALRNIFRRELGSKYNSFMLELELKIRDTLTDEVQDLGGLNLTALTERRRVSGTSLENIITRVLERGIPEVSEVQYESYKYSKDTPPLLRLCRLIGLYLSTQCPKFYIRKIQTTTNNNSCTLWDGRKEKIFRIIDGVWKLIR